MLNSPLRFTLVLLNFILTCCHLLAPCIASIVHFVLLNCHFPEQANKENDEVYTQVTLLPQAEVGFHFEVIYVLVCF